MTPAFRDALERLSCLRTLVVHAIGSYMMEILTGIRAPVTHMELNFKLTFGSGPPLDTFTQTLQYIFASSQCFVSHVSQFRYSVSSSTHSRNQFPTTVCSILYKSSYPHLSQILSSLSCQPFTRILATKVSRPLLTCIRRGPNWSF